MCRIVLFILVFSISFSCKKEAETDSNLNNACLNFETSYTKKHTLSSDWHFIGFIKDNKTECKPSQINPMTISFSDTSTFSGTSSCNGFSGKHELFNQDSISVSELFSTLKFCTQEFVMNWEEVYLNGLKSASTYQIDGNRLTLKTKDHISLIFKAE